MQIGRFRVDGGHIAAFVVGVIGLFAQPIYDALVARTPINIPWLVALLTTGGVGALLAALYKETIAPDLTGKGGGADKVNIPRFPPLDPPRSERGLLANLRQAHTSLAMFGACVMLAFGLTGCTKFEQAAFPLIDQISTIIAADLAAGKHIDEIEADVAIAVAKDTNHDPRVAADIVQLTNDVLKTLIDAGLLPPPSLSRANEALALETAKLKARGPASAP